MIHRSQKFAAKPVLGLPPFFNWRKKYAGLMPSEMKRLRQLEDENNWLKKIVADLSLNKAMLQDVLSKKL